MAALPTHSRRFPLWGASLFVFSTAFAAFYALPFSVATAAELVEPLPRALLVGGGPNPDANPVAIESNLRYLHRLLGIKKSQTGTTTLFADGSAKTATVLFQAAYPSQGEELLDMLLEERHTDGGGGEQLRASQLSSCDGAATKPQISQAIQTLAQTPDNRPLMVYFTGHGGHNDADLDNNFYMLWNDDKLTVRDLAREMKALPTSQRVALIMVQCFSGAFANLLFEDGDPKGATISRDFAGYFAATKERVAAGCTSEVNEAEYHDFTSYFFAALSGRDRLGHPVKGADYNKDGQVGMDEAYAYSLIHDESIDVPVRTLDAFVRRFSTVSEAQIFATPYAKIQMWADPGQRVALDELSAYLKLSGEDRVSKAWDTLQHPPSGGVPTQEMPHQEALMRMYQGARTRLVNQFPDLRSRDEATRQRAETAAVQWLNTALTAEGKTERRDAPRDAPMATPAVWMPLLDTIHQIQAGQGESERREIEESHFLRFVRLGKTIVLQHDLASNGTPELQARMTRLLVSERRSLPLKANF